MSTLNIQIGKDIIKGTLVGSNKWEFWLDSKKFSIDSPDGTQHTVEVLLKESVVLEGKQLRPNVWTTEHSFYGSSAWGSVSIWYIMEFNTKSMTALVKNETNTDA